MSKFKEIFSNQENNLFNPILPKDYLNSTISKNEHKNISKFADLIIENPSFIKNIEGFNKKLLNEIIIHKLNKSNFNFIEKGKILKEMIKENIIDKNYSSLLKEYLLKAKQEKLFETNTILTEIEIKKWIKTTVDDVKKILQGFKTALGAFGKAFIGFLKGFTEIEIKKLAQLLKDKDFISLAKYIGNWLLQRFSDAGTLYKEIHSILENSIFKTIGNTNIVLWLKNFLKKHIQDKLDELTDISKGNPQIIKIINEKYNGNKDEALLDKEVLKLVLQDKGVAKTGAILFLKMGIGAYLAYLSWEIWNTMVFKGDLIYDYNFSAALDAIKGKYDLSEWFFSEQGTETLIWYFLGALGVPSLAPPSKMAQIALAIVVTVLMIWIKKHPNKWKEFLNSEIVKKIKEIYENSKKRIISEAEKILNEIKEKLTLIKKLALKAKILKVNAISI